MKEYREAAARCAAEAGLDYDQALAVVTVPRERERADLTLPCFRFAKQRREPPAAIARKVAAAFAPGDLLQSAAAAGPFVNFRLVRPRFFRRILERVDENHGRSEVGAGRRVVVDYGSPNMAKPLLFHHLRSAVIGQALCNLHRWCGYEVIGLNYLGDAGTPFGKLMVGLEGAPETDYAGTLNEAYRKGSRACAEDEAAMARARDWARRLEAGDAEAVRLWEKTREISLAGFARIYGLLGVRHDVVDSEKMYFEPAARLVKSLLAQGKAHESEGAVVVDLEAAGLGVLLVRKSDGATLYQTRDLAAAADRWQRYAFARMLYVVDIAQEHYFKQLFAGLAAIGNPWADRCRHVAFGQVMMSGKRTKSREGHGVLLEEVLEEGVRRAASIIEEKNPALRDKEAVAKAVGVGAVVFSDVGYPARKNINFDWEEILSFDGRTGPYLQYVHASAGSILRKAGGQPGAADPGLLEHDFEWNLARRLAEFPEVVEKACEECEPSAVAGFLYDLAREFRAYHTAGSRDASLRVLTAAEPLRSARLTLVRAVRDTLRAGLRLLGITPVGEM